MEKQNKSPSYIPHPELVTQATQQIVTSVIQHKGIAFCAQDLQLGT